MKRSNLLVAVSLGMLLGVTTQAEQIPVKHTQRPEHLFMVTRSEAGAILAKDEFVQIVDHDKVTMHLAYQFVDGSVDDETTTYTQQGTFRLVRYQHIQRGPFFTKPIDFTVDATTGVATRRIADKNGKMRLDSEHASLPDDLANGFVGTLLLNITHDTAPFRVGLLVPVGGVRLVRILISPQGQQPFQMAGQTFKANVFRIHPELSGLVGMIAALIGIQPKDVTVWVREGETPVVVKIVGQLGGYGPEVTSELEGTSFAR